jgi:hypothetical protein
MRATRLGLAVQHPSLAAVVQALKAVPWAPVEPWVPVVVLPVQSVVLRTFVAGEPERPLRLALEEEVLRTCVAGVQEPMRAEASEVAR